MNKLISIEGVDGSGKTSLVANLQKLGYTRFTEIPKHIDETVARQDKLGYMIRQRLREEHTDSPEFRVELAFMFTEYRLQYQVRLAKELEDNDVIIDRGILSTMVYGYTDNEEANSVIASTNFLTKKPDVTIYLDIDSKVAVERLQQRDNKSEAYKSEKVIVKNLEYFNLFTDKYKEELNIVKVDASESEQLVLAKVLSIIEGV